MYAYTCIVGDLGLLTGGSRSTRISGRVATSGLGAMILPFGTYFAVRTDAPGLARIGFIGVGEMAGPMARHLVDEGSKVKVFDVDATAWSAVVNAGAIDSGSVAGAVEDADDARLSLPGLDDVLAVIDSIESASPPALCWSIPRHRARLRRTPSPSDWRHDPATSWVRRQRRPGGQRRERLCCLLAVIGPYLTPASRSSPRSLTRGST